MEQDLSGRVTGTVTQNHDIQQERIRGHCDWDVSRSITSRVDNGAYVDVHRCCAMRIRWHKCLYSGLRPGQNFFSFLSFHCWIRPGVQNIGIFVHHNVNNSADPVSRTYVDWMRDEFLIGFRTAASSYFRRAAEWEIVHTVIWLYSCWFAKLSDWPASQCLPAVEKDTLLMINMRTHGAPAQIQSLCHIEVISDKNADVSL